MEGGTCPLVKVHVTCARTKECQNGRWVLTKHEFTLAYGDTIRATAAPTVENADQTNPGRGMVDARRRLEGWFTARNRPVMAQIKAMAQGCAAP